jgi:hypothetical protein
MSRTSGIALQILVFAIFASSMFFFSLAVSHAEENAGKVLIEAFNAGVTDAIEAKKKLEEETTVDDDHDADHAQENEANLCTPEEQKYDANHRELLGMPPGECVQALPGYPTRAAGWGAAVKAQAKKHSEAYPGLLDMIDEPKDQRQMATTVRRPHNSGQGALSWL